MKRTHRMEYDSLGTKRIPAEAYYGIQTIRAMENFPVTGVPISHYPQFPVALAHIKRAAAEANASLKLLPAKKCRAIVGACREIVRGKWHDQFVVDVIQGGAGTSTNMNANEVIANRGLDLMGKSKGEYEFLHPLDDVNLSQSTNDVYPTAVKLAAAFMLSDLTTAVEYCAHSFEHKSRQLRHVLTMGRTQMQDAVPMTLGQGFAAYAVTLREDIERIREARALLTEINLGATAIGTGINTHPEYQKRVREYLSAATGFRFITAPDLFEATQDTGVFVLLSGVLKRLAVKLSKIADDLRLLSSGPIAGLGEINLPAMQPGSSIMPGKVNPVIPEVVNQISFRVMGSDVTVTIAAASGQLQLNAFEPIIVYSIFESIRSLTVGCRIFADKCVAGITANEARCRSNVERSPGLATFLNPYIGYERAAEIAKECLNTGTPVLELVLQRGWMTKEQLEKVLMPETMTSPTIRHVVRRKARKK